MTLLRSLWTEYLRQIRSRAVNKRWTAHRQELRRRRDALIVEHMHLVEKIARQTLNKFTRNGRDGYAAHLEMEDFIGAGYIGLVQAADRFKPNSGKFEAFAYFRIRGAMIDAHRRAQYREGQHASLEAIQDLKGRLPASMDTDPAPLADELADERDRAARLAEAVGRLPDVERSLIQAQLAGEGTTAAAAPHGHGPAWARAKMASARERLAQEVQRPRASRTPKRAAPVKPPLRKAA